MFPYLFIFILPKGLIVFLKSIRSCILVAEVGIAPTPLAYETSMLLLHYSAFYIPFLIIRLEVSNQS